MANEYPVMTMVDMARIPEEAFDRFLVELPMMVNAMRGYIAMMEALRDAGAIPDATDATIMESVKGMRWIDDDKGNVTVSITAEDAEGKKTPLLNLDANYKTGACKLDMLGMEQSA